MAVIEKNTLNGANVVTSMKQAGNVVLVKSTCMDGAATTAVMVTTVIYCCDELQADRFINCMWKWEAAKDQGSFGLEASQGKISYNAKVAVRSK